MAEDPNLLHYGDNLDVLRLSSAVSFGPTAAR
jgi:hypothetical protein